MFNPVPRSLCLHSVLSPEHGTTTHEYNRCCLQSSEGLDPFKYQSPYLNIFSS